MTGSSSDWQRRWDVALRLSDEAGSMARKAVFAAPAMKGDGTVVTQADLAIERELRHAIGVSLPMDHVFGEEDGGRFGDVTWVIDPIDGTSNFSKSIPFWCVSIAVFEGSNPVIGIIRDPVHDETFAARRGHGSFLNGDRLACRQVAGLEGARVAFGYTRRTPYVRTVETITSLLAHGATLRAQGAGALSMAYVAAGRLDGFFEASIHVWDCAAAMLIIEEAGGWTRADPTWDTPALSFAICAGAPGIEEPMTEATRPLF